MFLTIVTMCSDKTVLTTIGARSTDMITWFTVCTMTATTVSAVQSKMSRWTLYGKKDVLVTLRVVSSYTNISMLLKISQCVWILKQKTIEFIYNKVYMHRSVVLPLLQSLLVYPGSQPPSQWPVCLLHW